ncbi:UNVERIFIED_CONTAM: hypothetical protein Sradi_4849100 [Sesamum radiatum]|uniref:RNase H type-1 domain-containing protein n=1 Tax=Sesamum radiatum TaxID=300843 RepID=A0AAW2N0Q3_SESRA
MGCSQFGVPTTLLVLLKTARVLAHLERRIPPGGGGYGNQNFLTRNQKLMEGQCLDPPQVVCFASHYLKSFLCQSSGSAASVGYRSFSRWQAPAPDLIKLNFEGATFAQGRKMGVGVVARDANGDCLAWLSWRVARPGDGEMAEAWAVREAVQLAVQKGWKMVVFEGDCANLITKLSTPGRDLSFIGPIVADIHSLISNFLSVQFGLVKRSGNSVAHFLAQSGRDFVEGEHVLPPAVEALVSLNSVLQ